jgi:acyl dehydratase
MKTLSISETKYNKMPKTLQFWPKVITKLDFFSSYTYDDFKDVKIKAELTNFKIDKDHLEKFMKITDFQKVDKIPAAYFQVLAAPIHMSLLTNKIFPFSFLGLVHLRNDIFYYSPLNLTQDVLRLECEVGDWYEVRGGVVFIIKNKVFHNVKCIWESHIHVLKRGKNRAGSPQIKSTKIGFPSNYNENENENENWYKLDDFSLPEDLGRKYAIIAKDRNPIHQYSWVAKLFGYSRAIIHGMWTFSWVLSKLESIKELDEPTCIKVWFLRPIYLPSTILTRVLKLEKKIVYETSLSNKTNQVRMSVLIERIKDQS